MTENILFMTLGGSAVAHFVVTCVMAIFARHRVQYLCLPWVNGIFCCTMLVASLFSRDIAEGHPGILHPGMLLALLCACYLQSIYPLNISMPGFLQWERMWRYACPILVLLAIYVGAALLGSHIVLIYSASELTENILSSDILLRLCALGLSIYYIVNIFMLPHRMARHANVPGYLLGYCVAMGLSVVFYTCIAIYYNLTMLAIYTVLFTLLNLYLAFRTLETLAVQLRHPVISEVKKVPAVDMTKEQEDFNEANLLRFQHINFWMQQNRDEWKDNSFGRERLCQAVGLNRHLILQSIRSQGFNNVHDYICSFRVAELKRMIERGEVVSIKETTDVGFNTLKTVRSSFLKIEGVSLDDYLKQFTEEEGSEEETQEPDEENPQETIEEQEQ